MRVLQRADRAARIAIRAVLPFSLSCLSSVCFLLMPTRLDRYLIREILQTWIAVAVVFMVVLLSNQLARLLAKVVAGEIQADVVFTILGLKALGYLVILLPFALFLAQLLAMGRFYQDQELVAMHATGYGLKDLYRALFWVAGPLAVLVLVLSLWVKPWAKERATVFMHESMQATDVSGFISGRFKESSSGKRVFYSQQVSADGQTMENVFVYSTGTAGPGYSWSRRARFEIDEETGDRYLVMEQGHRYDGNPGKDGFRMVSFERHGVRVAQPDSEVTLNREAKTTRTLRESALKEDQVEFWWRWLLPLTPLGLTLLAVPLGQIQPRQGRYTRLVPGILVFVVYFNLLTLGKSWVLKGLTPYALQTLWVHGLFVLFALILLYRLLGRRWVLECLRPRRLASDGERD